MCKPFFRAFVVGLLLMPAYPVSAAQLYWNDANVIHRAALDGSGPQNLDPTYNALGIAADPANGLFWTDDIPRVPIGPTGTIRHAALDGVGLTDVLPGIPTPIGIAVDAAHGKMYWTDTDNEIRRANLDGTGVENLIRQPSIADLSGIVVDAAHNRLYFSFVNPLIDSARPGGIGSAHLDGSDFQIAVSALVNPQGLGLDPSGNLYWADVNRIQRAPIGGTAQDLVTGLNRPFGLALDVPDQMVFWTDSGAGVIGQVPFSGGKAITVLSQLNNPTAIAISVSGSYWIGANSPNWADSGNWSGAVPGAASGTTNIDTATFDRNASTSPLTIDAGRNVQNLTFDNASVNSLTIGAIGGQALLLTAGGTIQTTSTVANPQTVDSPLVLEGDYTFTSGASSGTAMLRFGGGIVPAATSGITTLTLTGSNTGANTISGVLADNGSGQLAITKSGTGVWILSGANTYSGATTVLGGTLKFNITSGMPTIAAGVTATVASGATLELAGSVSALGTAGGNRVHIVNNSSASGVVVSGTNQVVGAIDGSGNTTVNAGSDLTANHIIQSALVIGGTAGNPAVVTIDASDATGNPLSASSGFALASTLESGEPFTSGLLGSSNWPTTSGSSTSELTLGAETVGVSNLGRRAAAIPEPTTLLLGLLGLALFGCLNRRKPK
jgi:autotransporter-associated beta strand protein